MKPLNHTELSGLKSGDPVSIAMQTIGAPMLDNAVFVRQKSYKKIIVDFYGTLKVVPQVYPGRKINYFDKKENNA